MDEINTDKTDVCRLCLQDGELQSIFNPSNYAQKVMSCTSVKVFPNDNLPSVICQLCVANLNNAYSFKQQCEESDVKLRCHINNSVNRLALSSGTCEEKLTAEEEIIKVENLVIKHEEIILENEDFLDNGLYLEHSFVDQLEEEDRPLSNILKEKCSRKLKRKSNARIKKNNVNDVFSLTETSDKLDKVINKKAKKLKKSSGKVTAVKQDDSLKEENMIDLAIKKTRKKGKGKQTFECDICTNVSVSKSALLMHMRSHTGNQDMHSSFSLLPTISETRGSINENVEKVLDQDIIFDTSSSDSGSLVSEEDDLLYDSPSNPLSSSSELGERPFECSVCGKTFSTASNLERHMLSHSDVRPHFCHVCGRTFTMRSSLRTHMRTHTGEKPFACEECGAKFSQIGSLVTHRRRHTGEHPFVCDLCGGAFTTHGGLARHKRTHSGERKAQCNVCGKKFVSLSYLPEHMRLHTGEKPFKCKVCGKEFRLAGNLSVHARSHAVAGAHVCPQCGKACTDLKGHLRVHSGERPYPCEHCGKKFRQYSTLKYHISTHTGERKYSCHMCNKVFKTNEILKGHVNLHTGETPYHCEFCEKPFRSNELKRKHIAKSHREPPMAKKSKSKNKKPIRDKLPSESEHLNADIISSSLNSFSVDVSNIYDAAEESVKDLQKDDQLKQGLKIRRKLPRILQRNEKMLRVNDYDIDISNIVKMEQPLQNTSIQENLVKIVEWRKKS